MKVELPSRYAENHVTIPDKNLVQVLRPNPVELPADEGELIERQSCRFDNSR